MKEVETFLKRFHLSQDVDEVFTRGCCFWFAHILHSRFPKSRIVIDIVENHFATEIDGHVYDITGDVTGDYNFVRWDDVDDDLYKQHVTRDCINF